MVTPHRLKNRMPPAGRALLILVAVLVALAGHTAAAQETAPDLTVTVRDADDNGIADVVVLVRDGGGSQVIARGVTTDAAGVATIAGVSLSEVRVAVQGALPDGTPLRQTGQDARGVALFLTFGPATLDLRVEPDGLVIPDPATMIALDPGADLLAAGTPVIIVEAAPTAPTVAAPLPSAEIMAPDALEAPASPAAPVTAPDDPAPAQAGPPLVAVALLVGALIALGLVGVAYLRLQLRRRR